MLLLSSAAAIADTLSSQCSSLLRSFPSSSTPPPTWRPGTDCCRDGWDGVTCSPSTRGLLITSLDLADRNLSGPIGSSLFDITSLDSLNLAYNPLFDTIPSSGFKNLPNLTRLNLSYSNFSGQIPLGISRLTKLVSLDLSYNGNLQLNDPNFEMLFQRLFSLEELYLDGVNISESLGRLARVLAKAAPRIKVLSLSNCSLSGPIDSSLSKLSALSVLDLSNNVLSGEVPSSVFQLSGLKFLSLARNDFNGTVETDWFRGLKNLSHIDLSYNSLSVQVGDGNSYPALDWLGLASCNLTQVPSFLRYHNIVLDFLDLSINRIGGAIPNWILGNGGDLRVQSLNLSHNQFTSVESPHTFSKYSMESLDLHSNLLQGPIPIPPKKTFLLDYSNNNFSSIPANISLYLTSTVFFSLANNSIKGEIPPSICEARFLGVLDFSENIFSGPIPPCLLEISNDLYVLNLKNNQIQSVIPWNISRSCGLRTLNLNGNRLEGRVPPSLTNCHGLEVLDLGNNRIADSFPHWLSSISSLRVLVLRSNEFYGPITRPALGSNATDHYTFLVLQILCLSSNHFNDTLPLDFFKGLKGMMVDSSPNCSTLSSFYYYDALTIVAKGVEYSLVRILTTFTAIDLSNNEFTGNIPELIGELRYLHILNLSHNSLTGQIPASIGNMMQIESLDMSRNRLSGEIPQGLVSLTFLSVLNLSDNKLVGRIPQGNQLSTFSSASYQRNEGLCGIPLPKQCGGYAGPPITGGGSHHSDDSDSTYVIGLAFFTGLGYGIGIALVFVFQNVSLRQGICGS